jgi:PAS domain S-box-containing protein
MNPLNPEVSMQELQARVAQLEHQNAALRSSENRDRLLEATATAAKALLTIENLDEAVNSALQIIGECLDCDRVAVIDHFDDPSQPLPCWRILYEWDSPHTVSQISHSEAAQGTYQGIEDWYERLSQGQGISYLLEEMPEPFRIGQAVIGVKALHVVPIFVEGQFWGMVGFDDCREAKHRSSSELAVLKTAAACIGSAIQRERLHRAALQTQKAILQAEQERVAQLEVQNRLLENRDRLLQATAKAVKASLTLENFEEAVNSALQILGEASGCDRINILENFLDTASTKPAYYTVIYEWVREGTLAQISHLKSGSISSQGIEEFMERYFARGDGFGGLIDEWEEPLRSAFKAVEVQSTYSTPIRVNGHWWGVLCFDYCREPIRVSPAEVAVLKTIADCIGSAIQRERLRSAALRTQKAILQAEKERAAELERINAELQRAIAHLAESEKRYRTLFELSSEGIHRAAFDEPIPVTLPVDEQVELCYRHLYIAEANAAFAAMYGYEKPEDIIGLRMTDIHIANSEKNKAFMRAQIENGYRILNAESEEVDRHGRKLYFLNNTVCTIEDGCVTGGWGTQTDITELREAQQTLLRVEQLRVAQFAKANVILKKTLDVLATEPELDRALGHVLQVTSEQLESSSSALWLFRPESDRFSIHLVYLNGEIIAALPETVDRLNGQWLRDRDLSRDLAFKQHIRDRAPVIYDLENHPESTPLQRRFMKRLGAKTLLGIPLLLGSEIVGSLTIRFRDRREFQAEELELTQALAHQATLAIQLTRLGQQAKQAAILEERNRIARDIHDSLAQSLTGIVMQLNAATEFLAREPDRTQACITRAQDLAKQGLAEARRSVWLLYQSDRTACGLSDSLKRLVEQMTTGTTARISLSVDGTPYCLDATVSMNLLRIAQESLTNALRHAKPQIIHLELTYTSERIQLRVSDDGCGFNPQQTGGRGLGLVGMSDRAGAIGAQLQIRSKLGAGTETTVTVAIAP